MTAPELPNAPEANAVGAPVEQPVRPRAWAIFVDNGNARMWSTLQPHVQKLADAEGLTITPLYDQAALDAAVAAAVAAEREQMRAQAARDAVETRWAMREQIAAWLDGQGQPGYATEVRCRDWA